MPPHVSVRQTTRVSVPDYRYDPRLPILRSFFERADCPVVAYSRVFLEAAQRCGCQPAIDRLEKQSLEFGAVHSVLDFVSHQITCLYVRESKRASSARPRFILDFTVPSGTLRAVAISR